MKPVTSGYRLVLTYNLVRQSASCEDLPSADGLDYRGEGIGRVLKAWNEEVMTKRRAPQFLCYRLEHQYTNDSLNLKSRKDVDQRRAQLVLKACKDSNFDLYLASLEREVSGLCDDYGSDSCEIHELINETERSLCLHQIVDLDGLTRLSTVVISKDDIIQDAPFDDRDPDEEDFRGYTGNEGATATQWYRESVGRSELTLNPSSLILN